MSPLAVIAHHHQDEGATAGRDLGELAWESDNVELTTVGIDIGSTTCHLMFARIHLQRSSTALTSRFEVVGREVLYRSPILLTPYLPDDTIEVDALWEFIHAAYREAGLERAEVDTGAVILTGAALQRRNSRRIADLFAEEGGRFVCASAGHTLEATLAAHGSGAVALSRHGGTTILNVDVGGGTTKFALIERGEVVATAAIAVGARVVATDAEGRVNRLEPSARPIGDRAGVGLAVGARLDASAKRAVGATVADIIVAAAQGRLLERGLGEYLLEGQLGAHAATGMTLSGGVAEVYYGREEADFGDLAGSIADGLRHRATELGIPILVPSEGIRATVIGASLFTVQVSGNTIFATPGVALPIHNLPVITVDAWLVDAGDSNAIRDTILAGRRQRHIATEALLVAVKWSGDPLYPLLRSLAAGIAEAHSAETPRPPILAVACEGDVAATLGSILAEEEGITEPMVVIDGLTLSEFDFIDIGEFTQPANVIPVVVKSLVFPDDDARLASFIAE